VVEYAVLLAHSSFATLGTWTHSAELWLSHVNWQIVGYAALGLIALRIASWVFRTR